MNLLTIEEAAKSLRISGCSVRRLIKKNEIPYRRVGAKLFFTENDLAVFLEKNFHPIRKEGQHHAV